MDKETRTWFLIVLFLLFLLFAGMVIVGIVFVSRAAPSKPAIAISVPINGAQLTEGQEIAIQSTATDSKGIISVELSVDNLVIREDKMPTPQNLVTLMQNWKATGAGAHTLSVRAFNADNTASEIAAVSVAVLPVIMPTPSRGTPIPTVAPVPTVAPQPAGPTATAVPGPCTNNSAFVQDVTVPDGTPWRPNQQFNKIWRLRNVGTCTWSPQYLLAFINGEAMTNIQVVVLPGNIAPNQTVDLMLAMTAPAAPGTHWGQWQLRNESAATFGIVAKVSIVTISPPPQALLTAPGNGFQVTTGTAVRVTFQGTSATEISNVALFINGVSQAKQTSRTPATTLTGAFDWKPAAGNYDLYAVATDIFGQQTASPHITGAILPPACQASINFRADRTTINRGEHTMLRWDVDCVKAVYLDGQGVGGHDARDIGPANSQTFTLRVNKNDNSIEERSVTIQVNQPAAPTPVPPTPVPPPPARRNITGDWVAGEWSVELNEAIGCSSSTCPIAGHLTHGVLPAPSQFEVQGTVNVTTGAVSFAAMIPGGQSFNGTVSADSRTMSGTLSGVGALTFTK